ncbi:MAG: DNA polymerase III subunit beta, partial [Sedimentitalea sp.]|nr:DNA polymerase III subunit beta [Sedimentitalea sp.]
VLIEAEGDRVQFRATDLDIEVVDKAPAQVERAGATTVPATTLHEIVRKLPDGALVSLTSDSAAGRLTVEAGRSNFSLATLPKEDFPVMASSEYSSNFSARAGVLRRLFDKSKFAISTEETRYYLNGVYMHVAEADGGKVLRCVATDGHRLARIDADLPPGAEAMPGVIVPRKTVGEMRKLLEEDDADIAVSVSETKIRFATPDITLTSKVIDGTFPDYTRVIPQGNTRRLEVDAAEFAQAVDRVATVSSERSRAVKLQLEEDRLILSVNAPDSGAAEEELAVAYGDEPLEIGFNAKYLLEIASQVDRENAVFLFNSAGEPTLMREGNDQSAIYVVMPMRV